MAWSLGLRAVFFVSAALFLGLGLVAPAIMGKAGPNADEPGEQLTCAGTDNIMARGDDAQEC